MTTQHRVTSHDVARRAGVSRATVSLVLNRSQAVALSQETRERVLQAAADLSYRPNSAARMLVKGASETIGLVISDVALLPVDAFIPRVLQGIAEVNRRHGFHVLLEGMAKGDAGSPYQDLVESRRIDGLIVLNPMAQDEALKTLIDQKFPVVLVGSMRHAGEASVTFSARETIRKAVDHVVGLGHRRIGAVTFSRPGFVATDARLSALDWALRGYGLKLDPGDRAFGDFSAESGHEATLDLLRRRPDLTMIFAGNDTIAIGVIGAAAALGRRVPQDLSVIGFDDLPFAGWLTPPLTTIRTDAVRQGALAAEMLIQLMGQERLAERQVRLATEFIERASCAPARR